MKDAGILRIGYAWLHSDMKDMAYFYVYKLFDQIVEKGGLKCGLN